MRTIVNILRPLLSHIYFEGRTTNQLKTHQFIKLGIFFVPERRRIFPQFTVYDNLRVGGFLENGLPSIHKKMDEVVTAFPVLKERILQLDETLAEENREC